ncbi:MAG: helix-turn-helix domain-containing protein, partial [Gammaproteobacteria bacterium]|nr:helix-turn-helix domain-containing protein [Gammaproteobacteria bacterium]
MQKTSCPALTRPRSPVSILDWQRQILKLSDLTPGEKAAAISLSHYINSRSGYAWPSLATIAESCGAGEQTVRRAIRKLESL